MTSSRQLALQAYEVAGAKNPIDPMLLDVSDLCSYADYILVLGGRSTRQVEAVAEAIEVGMKAHGHDPVGREGQRGGQWVLLDYGDVVVHVFHEDVRAYYDIEGLWVDGTAVPLDEPPLLRAVDNAS